MLRTSVIMRLFDVSVGPAKLLSQFMNHLRRVKPWLDIPVQSDPRVPFSSHVCLVSAGVRLLDDSLCWHGGKTEQKAFGLET